MSRIIQLIVVTAALSAGASYAQDVPGGVSRTEARDTRSFDMGWMGLIGLAGLAGLMPRRDTRHDARASGAAVR